MKFTRRELFHTITLAAAGAVIAMMPSSVGAVFGETNRDIAWRLLDEAAALNRLGRRKMAIKVSDKLLHHLSIHFEPSPEHYVSPRREKLVKNIRDMFRSKQDLRTIVCNDDLVFAVLIVCEGLRNYKLPMVQGRNWSMFARKYATFVLTA